MQTTPSITEQALDEVDPVIVGQRQSSLLDIARRANTTADAWPLAKEAAATAAGILGMSFFAFGQLTSDSADEITLQIGEKESASGNVEINFSTAADRSAVGYALHARRPIVMADLDEELRFSDQLLIRRSIRSGLIAPLTDEERLFGVMAIFGRTGHEFSVDDVCYFELLTRLLSTSMGRTFAERELSEQRRLTTKMLDTTEALVVKLSPQLKIESINRAFEHTCGFATTEIADRPLSSAVLDSGDLQQVKQAFDRVRSGEEQVKFESGLLTKEGERRQVSWSYTAVTRPDGVVESLIGTGVDITDKCEALERLEQVERIAKAATQKLNQLQEEIRQRKEKDTEQSEEASDDSKNGLERRRNLRVPFPRMQEIAPIVDGKLPDRSRFLKVRCHDISAGGFSFFLPNTPDFEELVVALGEGDSRKYLTAKVLHARSAEFDGRRMKLVGCAYSGRLELISNSEHGDYFVMT